MRYGCGSRVGQQQDAGTGMCGCGCATFSRRYDNSICAPAALPRVFSSNMPTPSADLEELSAWLRLAQEPGLSAAQARHLLAAAGLPQQVYEMSWAALSRIVPETLATQLRRPPDALLAQRIEAGLRWLSVPAHHVCTLADPDYPQALLDLADPPLIHRI